MLAFVCTKTLFKASEIVKNIFLNTYLHNIQVFVESFYG